MDSHNRGRVYECLRCGRFRGEKRKAVAHVYKYHVAPDELPWYCSLCNFRCESERDIKRHVIYYSEHKRRQDEARTNNTYQEDHTYFLKNDNPRKVIVGEDIRQWEKLESDHFWNARTRVVVNRSGEPVGVPELLKSPEPVGERPVLADIPFANVPVNVNPQINSNPTSNEEGIEMNLLDTLLDRNFDETIFDNVTDEINDISTTDVTVRSTAELPTKASITAGSCSSSSTCSYSSCRSESCITVTQLKFVLEVLGEKINKVMEEQLGVLKEVRQELKKQTDRLERVERAVYEGRARNKESRRDKENKERSRSRRR